MPHKTIIRLSGVARNPANGFPARPLEAVKAGFDTRAKVEATTGEPKQVCVKSLNRLAAKGDIQRLGKGKTTRYMVPLFDSLP